MNAGGVRGVLKNNSGEILPFASIYVQQLKSGTSTNFDGYFEIKLASGMYDIVFQYLGYETVTKRVEVKNDYKILDVILLEKSIQLQSATIYGGKEDPAYTLMRKAIAKAPFHLQEIDWYSAEVYLKGSGRVIDAPFFIRKKLAEEGFDSTTAYISETVTEVEFTRPNTYKQNVISTRTSGSDNNSAQNSFIFGSFYQPDIGGLVSPLSKKAFAYYKFKYVESFSDRGYTINKIQVVPRSKGEGVVEGFLYLVENDWNIYRINFVTYQEGIKININEVYAPIEEKIWLPVNLKFDISGKFFGVKFEYKYLATIGKYKWKINPDLDFEVEIIDESIQKELAAQIEEMDQKMEISNNSTEVSKEDKKVTRKQLKKMLKEYESKEEENEPDETKDITSIYEFSIDSLANKKDSTYWDMVRSVPLDSVEVNGYQKLDSLLVLDQEKAKSDSTKKNSFSPFDLLFGYTFKFNDTNSLRVSVPMSFNTVDGFLLGAKLRFNHSISDSTLFQLFGETHYGFSRTTLLWQAKAKLNYGSLLHKGSISFSGGKMDIQYNGDEPISPILNTFTSLFMEDNFMKLYQNEYVRLDWNQNVHPKWELDFSAQYSVRTHLENTTNFTFFDYKNRGYTSNIPQNDEFNAGNPLQAIPENSNRFIVDVKSTIRPWQKLYVRNGIKKLSRNSSPSIWIRYINGNGLQKSGTSFEDISVGFSHYVKVQGGRRLRINSYGGVRTMRNSSNQDFIDFVHFMGNESPFVNSNPATQYRMLPYYQKSTTGEYASVFVNYEFKKLVLTQFFFLRMTGIKENLFANYLWTGNTGTNYFELGYSLDNLFRVLRIEVVTNNLNGPFTNWAIRFGITTNFSNE